MIISDDDMFAILRQTAHDLGLRVEQSDDGRVMRLLKSDGTVLIQARKRRYLCATCYGVWEGARDGHQCPEATQ